MHEALTWMSRRSSGSSSSFKSSVVQLGDVDFLHSRGPSLCSVRLRVRSGEDSGSQVRESTTLRSEEFRGVNVVRNLSQLLGDLTPVESNNRNIMEDSTFYTLLAIFFNFKIFVDLVVSLEDREGLDYVGSSL